MRLMRGMGPVHSNLRMSLTPASRRPNAQFRSVNQMPEIPGMWMTMTGPEFGLSEFFGCDSAI